MLWRSGKRLKSGHLNLLILWYGIGNGDNDGGVEWIQLHVAGVRLVGEVVDSSGSAAENGPCEATLQAGELVGLHDRSTSTSEAWKCHHRINGDHHPNPKKSMSVEKCRKDVWTLPQMRRRSTSNVQYPKVCLYFPWLSFVGHNSGCIFEFISVWIDPCVVGLKLALYCTHRYVV